MHFKNFFLSNYSTFSNEILQVATVKLTVANCKISFENVEYLLRKKLFNIDSPTTFRRVSVNFKNFFLSNYSTFSNEILQVPSVESAVATCKISFENVE